MDADGNPVFKEESSEYGSDYDSQGRYIWGEEGVDWEFYDQEDKDAWEKGENMMFEPMNPDAVPKEFNPYVDMKTGVHHSTIKAKVAQEAVYVQSKKKTKKMWKPGQ